MRFFVFALFVAAAAAARADLPDAVAQACFSASLRETDGEAVWTPGSWETWQNKSIRITEPKPGLTVADQDGTPHPMGWVKTRYTLHMPTPTAATPSPAQTLTLTVTGAGVLPKAGLSTDLIHRALLPPCTVTTHAGLPALVAKDGTWYILAGSPKAAVRSEKTDKGTVYTLRFPEVTLKGAASASFTLTVGEGQPAAVSQ